MATPVSASRLLLIATWAALLLAGLVSGAQSAVTIVKAPYLLWVTGTDVIFMWETSPAVNARVTITPEAGGTPILVDVTPTSTVAQAGYSGLTPGTRYLFSVSTTASPIQALGSGAFLTDSPGPRPMTFGVLGDTQELAANFLINNTRLMEHNPELILHVGDLMTNGTDASQWNTQLCTPGRDMLRFAPMYTSFGNHEANSPNIRTFLPYPETMTGNPVDSRGHYFTAQRGNAFFIMLDSQYAITPGSPQYVWVVNVMASTAFKSATWKILCCHYPAYSDGWQGYDGDYNMRTYLVPLMEQNGVDLYMKGHTHAYERGYLNGVTHIINGGGAAGNETWGRNWPFITRFALILQYSIIKINGDKLEFSCYDFGNKLYDRFTLQKGVPFTLPGAPVFVRGPKSKPVGVQTVTLKYPAGGSQRFRYRVAIDERRAEDGFWEATPIMYDARQEITLPVNFKVPGTYHVIAQALDAQYRASDWVKSEAVTIQ
jgi:predicted phosphodiesterase